MGHRSRAEYGWARFRMAAHLNTAADEIDCDRRQDFLLFSSACRVRISNLRKRQSHSNQ